MLLQEILDQLSAGELAFLKVGELENPAHLKKVISFINLGLIDIHTRFWLRRKEIEIEVIPNLTTYELHSRRSKQFGELETRYLLDSYGDPFINDLLKIEKIRNRNKETKDRRFSDTRCLEEQTEFEEPFNDEHQAYTFLELAYNKVKIPKGYLAPTFTVEYRASHPRIAVDEDTDPCHVEIDVSRVFLEPLLFFIAAKATRSLNPDQLQEQQNYYALYERGLLNIKQLGYVIVPDNVNLKLDCRGFV